ncbi:D-alanyl-D-alanine carboxypeptidase|uniref:serine-type D-Ala-D-Ala carboxypeptidase n=1 Tax=Dendrosporobacter quercicolus TaxID=146817 RepID=A0A1G9L398_9FIRM|nr:D-alanyl-D-alanine carboxypeptidase family protein [Dendrosporobacter quercicolus]NSL46577.1 D-alanyl-D-alanine carboxypeptidase [Dendrosporobacter quercicolus DSM 1736]SDL56314.1 D-alanyl-D-alanine carboxypeptidase (penicillin-binding protein 5/6) [Dendrosporobacter quercicolus]
MMRQCVILLCLGLFLLEPSGSLASPLEITAKSAIVMDASTGKILYEKAAQEQRYPASTTKIMTLIVALEHGNLEDMVTASPKAASTEGSSLWLEPGEKLQLLDLLYGIMLVSGNDATVAVAEHISGSMDNFAKLMTEKAHAIGAKNTNFVNSSGLPDPKHVTTAHDLAKIAAYGYKNPLFTQIVSTKEKVIPWPGKAHDRELYNENKMLWLFDGGNGVKTGYTEDAGRCLVSAARRNDIQLVAVVLDSEYMWDDSMALLDYGFKQLRPVTLFAKGDILKTVKIKDGKARTVALVTSSDMVVPVSGADQEEFKTIIDAPGNIAAPVNAGEKIGVARVMYKDTEIAAVDLLATETVERKSFFGLIWGSVWNFFTFVIKNFA